MPQYGNIVVIKRDGEDGVAFPMWRKHCVFGFDSNCDVRVQVNGVLAEHCQVEIEGAENRVAEI